MDQVYTISPIIDLFILHDHGKILVESRTSLCPYL